MNQETANNESVALIVTLPIGLNYGGIIQAFAMGTNNYGSAMRHRTKVLPVVLVVIAASRLLRNNYTGGRHS